MPFSSATRRATGETRGASGVAGAVAATGVTGFGVAAGAAAAAGAVVAAAPTGSRLASSAPTGTVWPCGAEIRVTTPDSGATTSASTLSVVISQRIWSFSTRSPSRTSQRSTVPSTTLSPIWGITTEIAIVRLRARSEVERAPLRAERRLHAHLAELRVRARGLADLGRGGLGHHRDRDLVDELP